MLEIQNLLHVSNEEMAEKLGFAEQDYLDGLESPSDALYAHICSTLGVSLHYLKEGLGPIFDTRALPLADILAFRDARNWKQFHTPKDLAISLSLEASELLECFQWSGSDVEVKNKKQEMEEELADILIYSVLFADSIGVDISTVIREKLEKNGKKYEVKKAYGNAKKYTEFTETD
jgi:NTP pyrophosphatase (non-canonical NTP hydrolase)